MVLADSIKRLIVDTVQDYDRYSAIRRRVGFDAVVSVAVLPPDLCVGV